MTAICFGNSISRIGKLINGVGIVAGIKATPTPPCHTGYGLTQYAKRLTASPRKSGSSALLILRQLC